MSRQSVDLDTAKSILGVDVIGLEEIRSAFGPIDGLETVSATVPFSSDDLQHAKAHQELLILRAPACSGEAMTLLWLIKRFADAFNPAYLRKVGYQLKDEWGIELEPLAGTETCRPGWSLVSKSVLKETLNLDYVDQDRILAARANGRGGRLRRRTATETAFDVIAYRQARGERLLAGAWDWSQSRTEDGGYLNLGHFDSNGIQVFSYSKAVRHGRLGVCPNLDPAE